MRALYLDLVGGIAGDMTVAALIDLGVSLETLREGLDTIGIDGIAINTVQETRHEIAGTRFLVRNQLEAETDAAAPPRLHTASYTAPYTTLRASIHTRPQAGLAPADRAPNSPQAPGLSQAPGSPEGPTHPPGHPHRPYREVRRLLEAAALPPGAQSRALRVFARLAEAEGAVHGTDPEQVTFHEVGAWDSIADVVCACLGLEALGIETVYCSPVPLGSGTVRTAHGVMPVPAPATLALLKGFPVTTGGPAYERTTPTGAALLATLATPAPEPLNLTPHHIGIGLGSKNPAAIPNLLRAVLGEIQPATASSGNRRFLNSSTNEDSTKDSTKDSGVTTETIECAEANLDDTNPEWLGYLMQQLFAAGALDVLLISAQMKKNRPGTLIQVLYPPQLRTTMEPLLFTESTTLGVRYHHLERRILDREAVSVETAWGPVMGKVARYQGQAHFAAEFESCRQVAEREAVPLRQVYAAAEAGWAMRDT